jgi:hypothetical protein
MGFGTMKRAVAAVVILAGCAASARAEDANHLLRFYYGVGQGKVARSPLDPAGTYANEPVDRTSLGALELILFRRVGISGSRQYVLRQFSDSLGVLQEEQWVQYSADLTLYLLESRHNSFNLYLGGGSGLVERYQYAVNKVTLSTPALHDNMPLTRGFAGMEFTLDRIGFRLEASVVEVEDHAGGMTNRIDQSYQLLSAYIPFN